MIASRGYSDCQESGERKREEGFIRSGGIWNGENEIKDELFFNCFILYKYFYIAMLVN